MKRKVVLALAIAAAALVAVLILHARRPTADSETARVIARAAASGRQVAIAGAAEPELQRDVDPRGALRLEGQVIDAADAPVAGAKVVLGTTPARIATTDAGGSFHFDGLLARTYVVVAQKGQRAGGPVTVRLTETSEPVTLRLRAAASIEVTVVGATDARPIAGAQVELRGVEIAGAVAEEDGRARFEGVAPGNYSIAVWAGGFARSFVRVRIPGQFVAAGMVLRQTIRLRAGAAVAGRVVSDSGQPVAGAQVMWVSAANAFEPTDSRRDAVVSGAQGGFRFEALPAGTFRFVARHDEHAPGSSQPVTLDGAAERSGVEIKLLAGALLEGHVVGKAGGAVSGAMVRVAAGGGRFAALSSPFESVRQTVADTEGHFRLTGLPRRDVSVVAVHETASSDTLTVHLANGAVSDLRIPLLLDGTIRGIVVDATGKPVADASVWAMSRGGGRLREPSTDRSDQGGRFELRGLAPQTYFLVANRSGDPPQGGFAGRMRGGTVAEPGDEGVRLVLEAIGALKGRVVMADGHVPPLFTVRVGRGPPAPFTSSDGAFLLEEVPIGQAEVVVGGPGFEPGMATASIESGQIADVGTITVKPGRTISGHVLTADHRPAPGATVYGGASLAGNGMQPGQTMGGPGGRWNAMNNPSPLSATTDDQGMFFLAGVGASEILLMADHDTFGRSQPVTVAAATDSQSADLVLAPFSSLDGIVTQDGQPGPSIVVAAAPQGTPDVTFTVATGPDGTFRFDRLAPDSYRVSAVGRGGGRGLGLHTAVVTLAAGQNGHVQLAMDSSPVTLLVTAQAADGSPASAMVYVVQGAVSAATAKALRVAVSASSASYTFVGFTGGGRPARAQNVVPGAYTVCAVPVPSSAQGPSAFGYLQQNGDKLPAFCIADTVASDPIEQSVAVPVTVPADPGH